MSFFDSKQEVIKIELTQHGRNLLSKGKFNPKYYSFYDDDVLYDTKYANLTESQRSSQERILNETPISKPQTSFSSLENNSRKLMNIINRNNGQPFLSPQSETNLSNLLPLGNSEPGTQKYPSLNLDVMFGKIDSIETVKNDNNYGNSSGKFLRVPQVNMQTGEYIVKASDEENSVANLTENEEIIGTVLLKDGTGINIIGNNTKSVSYFSFQELNALLLNEAFMLEIFTETEEDLNGEKLKVWKQLNFNKKRKYIKNRILLDNLDELEEEIDPDNAEWYFDISFDEEALDFNSRRRNNGLVYGSTNDLRRSQSGLTGEETIYDTDINDSDKPFGEDC